MKAPGLSLFIIGLWAGLCIPAHATVQIVSLTPSVKSPQVLGTAITWTATATDTNTGPLTFQFNVAPPRGTVINGMARDFNVGTLSSGTWTSQPFAWVPTGLEGTYQIQVVAKDFESGESVSKTAQFQITALVTAGVPVVVATANPLVALFSAPPCASGSSMRVHFQQQSKANPPTTSTWVTCHPPASMTFEVAGMYPSTTYQIYAQTITNGVVTAGTPVNFTTGALPTTIKFPTFKTIVGPGTQTDTTDDIILHNLVQLGGGTIYPSVATDLSGGIIWYYYPNNAAHTDVLARPLKNGGILSIENGTSWNPASQFQQLLRQVDLAGNIVRETNTGIIQQELLALGATGLGPCNAFSKPPPVGSACLGAFHHDAIQFAIGAITYTAVIADVEKIYPAGTQDDTSELPVDIVGDAIVVLNQNWQAVWYFDTFEHAGGAPQLDINRPAVLGETCVVGQSGCPPMFLLGSNIAPKAHDWLHANSLYYWPTDSSGGASGDIIWSARHQDWVMKVDYNNGTGTGNILWRMGPSGDFTFSNLYGDPWPWFSHQHDAGIEATGVMTIFDNGNTRVAAPPIGLGSPGCQPADCNSRGMSVTLNESDMTVQPVLSANLGYYSTAMGSAQLLPNGNYFFQPAIVLITLNNEAGYSMEILPNIGTDTGSTVLNLQGPEHYRGWQMTSLYSPPTT